MAIKKNLGKLWTKYKELPTRKKVTYTATFIVFQIITIVAIIYGHKLQEDLEPLAQKMDATPEAWLILSALIAIVSIPPLFGHELLALIAGYVYGSLYGFIILTVSSIVGESFVYFGFRYWFSGALDRFRDKHAKNYGIFVAVVEDGGIFMLWLIRMSVIPPHFSTPLFSSLRTITWWKWMAANILASPVKFFPPVYLGALLRNKSNNSILGDVVFAISTLVTVGVLWHIVRSYKVKKAEEQERIGREAAEAKLDDDGKDFEAAEMGVSEGAYIERSAGIEMMPMDGVVRGDTQAPKVWPDWVNEPGRAHFNDGQSHV